LSFLGVFIGNNFIMKHLLNNMSEEEKNSIREQHTDKLKVVTESFSKLVGSKLGDVKPINEQSNVPQGWDKLKVGQSIKLKNDRDGVVSSWSVVATSPNPGPGGSGSKLILFPSDESSKALTPDKIEVSFFPDEMKVSLPGGMNTIVKDEVVKKLPAKPEMITPDPNKPRQIKKDLDKKGFYTLYQPGKMWELGDETFTGFHIKKQGMKVLGPTRSLNGERYCNVSGITPDGLYIFLKLICRPSGGQRLMLMKVGNKTYPMDVQNDDLVDDINCPCPQG